MGRFRPAILSLSARQREDEEAVKRLLIPIGMGSEAARDTSMAGDAAFVAGAIATAIADRLVENSEILLLGGDSLRRPKNPNPPAE